MKRLLLQAALCLAASALPSFAADEAWRAGASPVVAAPALDALVPAGPHADYLAVGPHADPDGRFPKVLGVETKQKPPFEAESSLALNTTAPLAPGDVVLVRFFVRAVKTSDESNEATVGVVLQAVDEPLGRLFWREFNAKTGPEWREIALAGKMPPRGTTKGLEEGLPAGKGRLVLRLGYSPQVVEIAGLEVLRFPPGTALASLPKTAIGYAGSEADAPWRAEAAERIDRYRKQDLAVRVVDAAGKPVPGASVHVAQQTHAFLFGSAVDAKKLLQPSPDDPGVRKYREMFLKLFNSGTLENDFKYPNWEAHSDQSLQAFEWLKQQGIALRGHVFFAVSWARTQPKFAAVLPDPAKLRDAIYPRIDDLLARTGPYIARWDVANEPSRNPDVMKVCGEGLLADLFRRGRRDAPDARLFLNEAITFTPTAAFDYAEGLLDRLDKAGAPVGGLGVQCHYRDIATPPAQIVSSLDRLAKTGKRIEVTEFDINVTDDDYQAAYLRDFYTAVFSHPAVDSIQMWGFWEGRHWKPASALYRLDWSEKPVGRAYRELVWQTWWTDETAAADADGGVRLRGFRGDYLIEVDAGGRHAEKRVRLGDAPQAVDVALER